MRTSTLPPLGATLELRREAEALLEEGETLSAFVLDAVTRSIEYREAQRDFIAQGLASRERARKTGKFVRASTVIRKLSRRLQAVRVRAPR